MMNVEWEVFTQKSSSRTSAIRISLSPRGIFAVNQKAFEALGETKAVELLFDKVNKTFIGIRPCSPELKHAYELKQQGESQSYYIRGRAFCHFYGIEPKRTVLFEEIEVNDGILMLNLTKVSEIAQKSRRTKPIDKQQELIETVEEATPKAVEDNIPSSIPVTETVTAPAEPPKISLFGNRN